jgi:hypothetical protein
MENSMLSEEVLKESGSVFTTIVRLEFFDFSGELIFCEQFELDKTLINITFI